MCKRCLAAQAQATRRYYHDNKSHSSSQAASPMRATSASVEKAPRSDMASTSDLPASVTSSFASQLSDSARIIISCPVPGCSARIDGRQILCQTHLETFSKTAHRQDDGGTNGARMTPAQTGSPSSARPLSDPTLRSKKLLLLGNGKDRPILRRKTAEKRNPQFVPQQPTPKHSTPPSRGGSTGSPLSPECAAARPPIQSPPVSPGSSHNGEPARKRQRMSPSLGLSPAARLNGTETPRPSVAEAVPADKPAKIPIPRLDRRTSISSPQSPAISPGKKASPCVRPSSKQGMRKMPSQLSNLRFLDTQHEDGVLGLRLHQSSPGVKGFTESFSQPSHGEPTSSFSSLNGSIMGYWTEKTSISTSHVARPELSSADQSRQMPRMPDLLNGQDGDSLSDSRRAQARTPGNNTPSKQPLQAIHFPIRPAPLPAPVTRPQSPPSTTTPLSQKPKEIDSSVFDRLIYSQALATTPPPGLEISLAPPSSQPHPQHKSKDPPPRNEAEPPEKDEPLYLDIDPRLHWPQNHSPAWLSRKQEEIQARGGRKARFGRAAHSLRAQLRAAQMAPAEGSGSLAFEDSLPEKIAENPAWVRALRRLRGLGVPSPGAGEEDGGGGSGRNSVNGSGSGATSGGEGVGVQKRGGKGGKVR